MTAISNPIQPLVSYLAGLPGGSAVRVTGTFGTATTALLDALMFETFKNDDGDILAYFPQAEEHRFYISLRRSIAVEHHQDRQHEFKMLAFSSLDFETLLNNVCDTTEHYRPRYMFVHTSEPLPHEVHTWTRGHYNEALLAEMSAKWRIWLDRLREQNTIVIFHSFSRPRRLDGVERKPVTRLPHFDVVITAKTAELMPGSFEYILQQDVELLDPARDVNIQSTLHYESQHRESWLLTSSTTYRPRITLVAACAKNGTIGNDNQLVWRNTEDLQRFKQLTLNRVVIMGRKTFESIGRPLPDRRNIVITRNPDYTPAGVDIAHSYEDAIRLAGWAGEVFVIGGGEVYREAILTADRLCLTEVNVEIEGDTKFPDVSPEYWTRMPGGEKRKPGQDFEFVNYRRIKKQV